MKVRILIFLCVFLVLSFPLLARELAGELNPKTIPNLYEELKLERVVDGDTIYASNRKIRLWGIDAPEKGEPLHDISTKALELFIDKATLRCKQIDIDKYRRDVMHCFVNDADLGGSMVKTGFAKDYTKYSGGFYSSEENFAKDGRLGVWK